MSDDKRRSHDRRAERRHTGRYAHSGALAAGSSACTAGPAMRVFLGIASAVWLVTYSTFLAGNTSTVAAIIGIPTGAVLGWILLYAAMRGPRT